jgi:hypothetical protein
MARTTRAHPSPSGLKSLSTPKREVRKKEKVQPAKGKAQPAKEKVQPVTKTAKQKTAVSSQAKKKAPEPSPPTATSASDVESDPAAAPESRSTSPPAISRRITRSISRSFSPSQVANSISTIASTVTTEVKRRIAAVKATTPRTADTAAPLMSKPAAKPQGRKLQKPIRNKTSQQNISSTESAEEVEQPRPHAIKRTRSNRSVGSPVADDEARPIKRARQVKSEQIQPQQHSPEPVVASDYDMDVPAAHTPAQATVSHSVNPITPTIEAEHDEVMSSEEEDETTIIKTESRPSTSGSLEAFRPAFTPHDMSDLSFHSSTESTPRPLSGSAPQQLIQASAKSVAQATVQADSVPTSEQEAATPSVLNRSIDHSQPYFTPTAPSQHVSPAAEEHPINTSVASDVSSPFYSLPLGTPVGNRLASPTLINSDRSVKTFTPTARRGSATRKKHEFRRSTSEHQARLFGVIALDTAMNVDSSTEHQPTQSPQTPSKSPGTGMWGTLSKVKDAVLSPFKFIGLGNQTTTESPTPSKKVPAPEFTYVHPSNIPNLSEETPTKKLVRTIAPRTRKMPKPPGGEQPVVQEVHRLSNSTTKTPQRLRLMKPTPDQLATRHMGEITEERRQKSLGEQRVRAAVEAARAARAAEEAANSPQSLKSPVSSGRQFRATLAVAPDLSIIQELEESTLSTRQEKRNAFAATVEDDDDADNANEENMTLSQANQQVGGKRKRTYTAMTRPGTYSLPDEVLDDSDSDEESEFSGYANDVSMTLDSPARNSPASQWKGRTVFTPWDQPYKNDDAVNPYADRLVYEYTPPDVPLFFIKKPRILISQNFRVAQQYTGDYWRQLYEIQRVMTPQQRYWDDYERKNGFGSCENWLRIHRLLQDENGNFPSSGLGRDYYDLMRFKEFPEVIPAEGHRVLNPPTPEPVETSLGRTFKCPSPSSSSDESDDGSDDESELPKLAPEAPRPVHAELPVPQTPLGQLTGNIQKYTPSVSSNLRYVKNSSPLQLDADPASPRYLYRDRIEFSKLPFDGFSNEIVEALMRAPSPDFDGVEF